MGSMSYKLSDIAYTTIILHARKHPTNIIGVLLGTFNTECVEIDLVLPLIHSDLAMFTSPMHEMSLLLSEQKARQHQKQIVGIYYSNAIIGDTSIAEVPTFVANAVQTRIGSACLLLIDTNNLAEHIRKERHAFRVFVRNGQVSGTWGRSEVQHDALHVSDRALKMVDALINGSVLENEHLFLADFEDHCNDPGADWMNVKLSSRLNALQL